jgi:methylated-DNA-[protein]-cysteine S-methyltransferase
MMKQYTTFTTPFDTLSVVWIKGDTHDLVQQIFLSDSITSSEIKVRKKFPQVKSRMSLAIDDLVKQIQNFLNGQPVKFDLSLCNWQRCTDFQKRVLFAEAEIPRGWVSTYQRIANHLGIQKGARAVGNALARNPFPIIIPCHRAVKSTGHVGGYQGGSVMKQALLKKEGVQFTSRGKIIMNKIHY